MADRKSVALDRKPFQFSGTLLAAVSAGRRALVGAARLDVQGFVVRGFDSSTARRGGLMTKGECQMSFALLALAIFYAAWVGFFFIRPLIAAAVRWLNASANEIEHRHRLAERDRKARELQAARRGPDGPPVVIARSRYCPGIEQKEN